MYTAPWMKLKDITLSKKCQSPKVKYWMIPFIQHFKITKHRDEEQRRCCLGTGLQEHGLCVCVWEGMGSREVWGGLPMGQEEGVSLWRQNSSLSWLCWWFHESLDRFNCTETRPCTHTPLNAQRSSLELSKVSSPVHRSGLQYCSHVECSLENCTIVSKTSQMGKAGGDVTGLYYFCNHSWVYSYFKIERF